MRLRGMFEPRRLPGDFGDEIGFATQALGDVARGALSCLAVGGVNVENQLARVGKMLLVDFQPLHSGRVSRQQVEHFNIKSKARKSQRNWNRQHEPEPATRRAHGHGVK